MTVSGLCTEMTRNSTLDSKFTTSSINMSAEAQMDSSNSSEMEESLSVIEENK